MFVPDCAPYFRNGAQCIVCCFAYPLLQSLPELVISRLVQAAIFPQKKEMKQFPKAHIPIKVENCATWISIVLDIAQNEN